MMALSTSGEVMSEASPMILKTRPDQSFHASWSCMAQTSEGFLCPEGSFGSLGLPG